MIRSLGIDTYIKHIIAIVFILFEIILLATFYAANTTIHMDYLAYMYLINTMYEERLFYCTYLLTNDSKYLFFLPGNAMDNNSYDNLFKKYNISKETGYKFMYGCYSILSLNDIYNVTELPGSNKEVVAYNVSHYNVSIIPLFYLYNMSNLSKFTILPSISFIKEFQKEAFHFIFSKCFGNNDITRFFDFLISTYANFLDTFITDVIKKLSGNQNFEFSVQNSISVLVDFIAKFSGNCGLYNEYAFAPIFLAVDEERNLYLLQPRLFGVIKKETYCLYVNLSCDPNKNQCCIKKDTSCTEKDINTCS